MTKKIVYGSVNGKSVKTTLELVQDGNRLTNITAIPSGNWIYLDNDNSNGNVGHYTQQGNRKRYIAKLKSGTAVLVFGTGYWPSEISGFDWDWNARITEYRGGNPKIDDLLNSIQTI